jgi:hypothetical protein
VEGCGSDWLVSESHGNWSPRSHQESAVRDISKMKDERSHAQSSGGIEAFNLSRLLG